MAKSGDRGSAGGSGDLAAASDWLRVAVE